MIDPTGTALAALVAMVFFGAAVSKLRDSSTTVSAFANMGLLKRENVRFHRNANLLCALLIVSELTCAAGLLIAPRIGAAVGLCLLVLFTAVLARTVKTSSNVQCACFGQSSKRPIGVHTFIRNAMLGIALLPTLAVSKPRWEFGSLFVGVGATLLGIVIVQMAVLFDDTGQLFGQTKAVRRDSESSVNPPVGRAVVGFQSVEVQP